MRDIADGGMYSFLLKTRFGRALSPLDTTYYITTTTVDGLTANADSKLCSATSWS